MTDIATIKDFRTIYADTLIELAHEDPRVVVFEADLMSATGTKPFKELFPEQFINCGVAEANMVGIASGISSQGFIPFVNTFGCFATRRAYDQFFLSANYARQNVKLVGLDPGITAAFNGGTHMPFCDIALTRAIPDLVVVEPSDGWAVHHLTKAVYAHRGSAYVRLQRKGNPIFYDANQTFELGKGIIVQDGKDVTLIATGAVMLEQAILASQSLEKENISAAVLDMHTIKPLDKELVLSFAKKTNAIVTCENAQMAGGLGSAVSEFLAEEYPTLVRRVGIQDLFGEVGTVEYLINRFALTAKHIVQEAKEAIKRR
ncbi:transketolase C-terminal domain-containing protein [uncultured Sphaerochaeta sp.]|uniref:transketolase family protein n=1 Tax=uncultured Sphaerochaeta sp. TaxID=886478 RepID=UPI002A0A91EF|nr:transketolase C-terminal domain-containing protein [uncultured Sphaerochaeta sp.]